MFLRAFLDAVPTRGDADRAALAVHGAMLDHGYVCVGCAEPHVAAVPALQATADGAASLQIVPPGWNASQDSYSFGYVHPMRGADETFSVKALFIGSSLQVHAASSTQGADLLSATLEVSAPSGDDALAREKQLQSWQEKISSSVAMRLLQRNNSTARFAKALAQEAEGIGSATSSGGTKRPAPKEPRVEDDDDFRGGFRPGMVPDPGRGGIWVPPGRDPFGPSPNPFWVPGGGWLGPRHPAWGQTVPGGAGGGMMPRFDPIGPGLGDPNPDHLQVPGIPRDPRNPGRRMDPDNMFIM